MQRTGLPRRLAAVESFRPRLVQHCGEITAGLAIDLFAVWGIVRRRTLFAAEGLTEKLTCLFAGLLKPYLQVT